MRGLILKDLLNLRKNIRTVLIIGLAYSIFFSAFQPAAMVGIIMILFMTQSLTTFSYDEYSKWNLYALSLPISRQQLVKSKYIVSYLLLIVGAILSFLTTLVISLFKETFNLFELTSSTFACFSVMAVMLMILLPLIYKFGVERGRILILAVFGIPTLLILITFKLLTIMNISMPTPEQLELWLSYTPIIMPIFLALLTYLSYRLSIKLMLKTEL